MFERALKLRSAGGAVCVKKIDIDDLDIELILKR